MDRYTGNHTHHHGLLAGLGAGTAAVLGCFLLVLGVWHRVSSQVGTAVTVLVWTLVSAVLAAVVFLITYLGLRLRHHVTHPETLIRQRARAEVIPAPAAAEIPAPAPLAALPAPVVHNWNLHDPDTAAAVVRAVAEGRQEP
jgi:hypothetical protein